jgi:hypothetical protein
MNVGYKNHTHIILPKNRSLRWEEMGEKKEKEEPRKVIKNAGVMKKRENRENR